MTMTRLTENTRNHLIRRLRYRSAILRGALNKLKQAEKEKKYATRLRK